MLTRTAPLPLPARCARYGQGFWQCARCRVSKALPYDAAVWAKVGSYRPWPARVLFPEEVPPILQRSPLRRPDTVAVQFFGTNELQWVPVANILPFETYGKLYRRNSGRRSARASACMRSTEGVHR